jgi:hypothetical protein
MSCEQTRQLAAELALGLADGAERAEALRHLADCADCRRELAQLSEVTDELLMLALEREPPAGFESRVLAHLQPQRPTPRRARRWRGPLTVLAPAAVAAALAVTITLGATGDDRRLADQYRATLAAAHGSYFEAARLHAPANVAAGVVYAYRGTPSWIFVAVYGPFRFSGYRVELAMTSGRRVPLPTLRLDPRTGTAGQAIPVDVRQVSTVLLIDCARGELLQAQLPHAEPASR